MFSSFPEEVGLEERPFSHKTKPIAKAWPDPNSISEILNISIKTVEAQITIAFKSIRSKVVKFE